MWNLKKDDLLKVYSYAESLWTTFKPETEKEKAIMQAAVWLDILGAYELETISHAMKLCAEESDFLNIAKVGKKCRELLEVNEDLAYDEDKILAEISNAVSFYNAKENFEKLSPMAKAVVGHSSQLALWASASLESYATVVESNLRKAIRQKALLHRLKQENFTSLNYENKKMIKG